MVDKITTTLKPSGFVNKINEIIDNLDSGTSIDTSQLNYYGTCATAAATQAKVVVCPEFTELKEGVSIRVKFTNAQTYNGAPTLNVNSTGAKSVKSIGTTNAARYCWQSGEVVSFTYDGTNWIMGDAGVATTTYYGYTKLATSATSTSAALALTPASLNNLVSDMIEPYPVYSASATYSVGDRVRYQYQAWECTTAITTAEAWNAAHWKAIDPIQTQIDNLNAKGGRNVGEIVTSSLPLTDAGLHLLDGSSLSGDGIYGEFVQYIADLYEENPTANYWTTETDWQSSVSTYGVCGKFVYDSTNNTVRLPKVTGKIDGTTDINALGDLEPLFVRLPNITGDIGNSISDQASTNGALVVNNGSTGFTGGTYNWKRLSIDASRSSSVYSGNGSNTSIHEQAVKMFVYIVIATSTKTDIQADIDQIATDLNSKAGTDLANVTDTGKILMSGMGMPSNTYNSLAIGASGTTYTAPTNGYFYIYGGSGNDTSYHHITAFYNSANNWDSPTLRTSNNAPNAALTLFIPVKKQQTIRIEYNVTMRRIVFVYANGSESEVS
jgi:hypothetical protein